MQECLLFPPCNVPVSSLASWVFIFAMYCCLICLANLAGLSHGMLKISESIPYIFLEGISIPSSSTSESFRLSKVNTLKALSTSFQLKGSVRKEDLCCQDALTVQGGNQWRGGGASTRITRESHHMGVDPTNMGSAILQQTSKAPNNKKAT